MLGRSFVVPLLLLLLAVAAPVHAQTPSGEISGTVVDSSGLAVPGVTVTLTNQATNVVRESCRPTRSGLYVITGHPARDLRPEGRAGGIPHRRAEGHRRCRWAARTGSPFTMEVGELTETSRSSADSPLIQTENAAISTVIENRAIVELPLNGRNYLQLASLIPGATTNGPSSSQGKQRMGGQRNSFALNVAGQRIHYNHYSLDGVENTDLNFNSYMLLPSVDALEEFNVVSGLFDAEYGRAIAQVNVSTKSGIEPVSRHGVRVPAQFLARREELLRPASDRRSRRSSATSTARTLGGPVVLPKIVDGRNKLFFMFNWEGLRENKSLTQTPSLPLTRLAQRRFLRPARRQRQPDPDLRSGDARVRRRRQRAAGADAVPRQSAFRRTGSIRSRKSCWPTSRCRTQEVTGANFVNNEARRRQCRPVHLPDRLHAEREVELVLPAQHLARARLRSVPDPGHGEQHRHRRAAAGVRQHAHASARTSSTTCGSGSAT